MGSILVVSGNQRGTYFPLDKDRTVIGRDENCDLQIVDEMVSRHHIEICFDAEKGVHDVKDLHSSNGVYVNGRRVDNETRLKDKDAIKIGESKMLYSVKNFRDLETAMAYMKQRGQHDKNTLVQ